MANGQRARCRADGIIISHCHNDCQNQLHPLYLHRAVVKSEANRLADFSCNAIVKVPPTMAADAHAHTHGLIPIVTLLFIPPTHTSATIVLVNELPS
ncbi:hypothetical protein LSTR_LSTR015354 [Laodelphax striatellus]|uniref:Uncharacterized protein n=1 Tax=Laodelphax striatellus TaxID=195883 RepID=A0A482X3E3_LAOST|nr:hypothetical protein LSTR_LSTR015168 [Laodelphax striatellus]RZF41170.1 hypothetical protein LSTR_LSTR015354 [Laodelphax striatellus]